MESKFQDGNVRDLLDIVEQSSAGIDQLDLECDSGCFSQDSRKVLQKKLELPGKCKNDVTEFLRCIYPNSLTQVSCDTALKILPLVEEYQVMHVKTRCEKALLESVAESSKPTTEKLCQLLKEACLYSLKELRERCVQLASTKSQAELEIAYRRHSPPADAQNEILVKVNANLRLKVTGLQKANAELAGEVGELTNYFAGDLKNSGDFPIADGCYWQEKDMFFILEVDKMPLATIKSAKMWESSISVSAERKTVNEYSSIRRKNVDVHWLRFKITFQRDEPAVCTVYIKCTLVSRKTRKENLSFRLKKDMNGLGETIKFDLKKISDIRKEFVRDRKVGLMVQLYLSAPK